MPSIVRIDSLGGSGGKVRGWQARVYLWTGKKPVAYISKLFSDRKYGGKEKAYRAAAQWVEDEASLLKMAEKYAGLWYNKAANKKPRRR